LLPSSGIGVFFFLRDIKGFTDKQFALLGLVGEVSRVLFNVL